MIDFANIPTYKVSELENLSYSLLKERCWPSIEIPIDIDFLVEKEPNVDLDIYKHLKKKFDIAGMVLKKKDGTFLVLIDEDIADNNPNFYRFTVAEELAHLRLHRRIIDQITDFDSVCEFFKWSGYHEVDRNAKRFAASLLMPGKNLSEDAHRLYPELVKTTGFNNPDAVLSCLVNLLSKQYRVSPQSMKYRLTECPMKISDKVVAAMGEKLPFLD